MSQQPQGQEVVGSPNMSMRAKGLTPYEVMRSAPDNLTNTQDDHCEITPKYPVYYFFYGTLTAPATLQRIIDLSEEPVMRKAKVLGYTLAKWGDYPALIDGESGQEVDGYAYLAQTKEEAQKLAYYETNAYTEAHCLIYFDEEPIQVSGKTFVYAGDAKALLEQRFDRKLWLHQTGGKLV